MPHPKGGYAFRSRDRANGMKSKLDTRNLHRKNKMVHNPFIAILAAAEFPDKRGSDRGGEYCNLNPEPGRTVVARRAPLIFSAKIAGGQSYAARYGH